MVTLIVPNELLRGGRSALGISMAKLARESGLDYSTIRGIERDKRVSLKTLEKAAAALAAMGVTFRSSGPEGGPGLLLPPELRGSPGALMRAARSALGWSQADLARHSGIGKRTITRLESGGNCSQRSLEGLTRSVTRSGVDFGATDLSTSSGFRLALENISRMDLRV